MQLMWKSSIIQKGQALNISRYYRNLKKGDIFLNFFCVKSCLGVKNTLQNDNMRVKIITNVVGGIVEERVHTSNCFTLGSTNTFCQKEGWNLEAVY
jgi:hypothetical protein